MKVAICVASLAILAGVITAAPLFAWDPQTIYTYRVQSRFAAGMLGLEGPTVADTETDRAIIELVYHMDVYRNPSGQNEIYCNPRNFRAVIAEEQIHPREDPISTQKEVDIPQKARELLEKVMIVTLDPKSGVPDSIKVKAEQELTPTEKNIKRAQVQAFILNPGTAKLVVKGNLNRQTNSVRPSEQDDDSGFFYKVMEETIHGECQTYYTVSQTGPFQSLYQFEGQDVPVGEDEQTGTYTESAEQHSHPRFAQQQQWRQQQQQQQWQQQQWQQKQWQQGRGQNNDNEISEEGQQQPWVSAYKEFCKEGDQIYVIRKTVNLTACKERPVLSSMMPPEFLNCRPGDNNCGSLWNHVVFTRFLACGASREDFTIFEVNQEERFEYGLRTDENLDGYAVRNVTLEGKHKMRSPDTPDAHHYPSQGQHEYVIKSLVFEFDLQTQEQQLGNRVRHQQQTWQGQSHHKNQQYNSDSDSDSNEGPQGPHGPFTFPLQNQQPGLEEAPLRPHLVTSIVSEPQLLERALELLQKASHNILDPKKSIAEGETIAYLSVLAKTIRYMSLKQILELYEQAIQQYAHYHDQLVIVENNLCDAIVAAGTNPALVAMFTLIEEDKVNDIKAEQLVMTFAHYSRHPTTKFLERFLKFINHERVQKSNGLRTTSLLAYSILLHQACMNARTMQSSFSYALYGPFCQAKDVEPFVHATTKKLQQALEKSKKDFKREGHSKAHEVSLQLLVLGNIGHKSLIEVVQQILDNSYDVQEKSKAIFALKHLIRSHEENNPQQTEDGQVDTKQNQNEVDRIETDPITYEFVEKKVLPLLMSVAMDKSEHPVVRCAAIQMLTYCSAADITIWQQLAMSTWFPQSQDVHNFIYTTITNLAKLRFAPTRLHWQLIVKARSVQPLLRSLDEENASRSTNMFASGDIYGLDCDFFRQFTSFGSRDSSWPTSIYFRNFFTCGSGAIGVNPIEASVHFRTLQQIANKVSENFGSSSSEESGEQNQYMKKILDSILPREMKETPHGSVFVNFRNGMQRLWQVENLEKYLSWKSMITYMYLRRTIPFNYQKTIQLAHQTMAFPSILGFEMNLKVRLPVMLSFRGKVGMNGPREDPQLHAQVDLVVGYKRHAKISLKIPYLNRKIESGIQSHFVAQLPFRFTARARSDEAIVLAVTPTADINGTASGRIELVTFHRKPYVAVITDELYPTVATKGGEMNIIRTIEPATTSESHNDNVLGFSVVTREVSDYRPEMESPSAWARYFKRFPSFEAYANFGGIGGRYAKYAERKITLNVDESQSRSVIVLLAAKRGSGSLAEGFDTDVSSSSSSSSSSSESNESDSSNTSEDNKSRQDRNSQSFSSSSSSSSSSESNEDSNSNEDSKEVFQKSRVIVLALLTKREAVPPVSSLPSLVNLLQQKYPNQKQVLLQIALRTNKFFLRYAQGTAAEDAARSLPTDSNSIQHLAKAIFAPHYQGQQREFCSEVSGKMIYPNWAHQKLLVALRNTLLNHELKVDVQGLVQFAHTCKDADLKQNEISIDGEFLRGKNMTEWARSKSPEAQQCQEDENQGFTSSDDCLTVAFEQASALNRARLNIQWSDNLPEWLQQYVYTSRDVVKAVYWPHVYHDRFPETPANGNAAIVDFQLSPDAEFWYTRILTNETELKIRNVPSNTFIQAAFPLSALQPMTQNFEDYFYGQDSQPTCQLEGKYISSFDNVVGEFDPSVAQGCYHLLAADGSGDDSMAIFAKNVGTDNLKLQLVLSKTTIILAPQRAVQRNKIAQVEPANDIAAIVNGQAVSLPFTVRKQGQRSESNDYVARIQALPSGGVQILTYKNDIAFDGAKVIIFADESYRNKTVGMCGDFDGEKVADRRSRKDIPLSNPTLLYANYAYESEGQALCKDVKPEIEQLIKYEESFAKARRESGNHVSNLRWGRALFSRAQQQKAWENKHVQSSSSSSSSEEGNAQYHYVSHSAQQHPSRH